MSTEEDLEKAKPEAAHEADEAMAAESPEQGEEAEIPPQLGSEPPEADLDDEGAAAAPMQLGYMRFVYAAYMAGAMLVAFLLAKSGHAAWYRLGQWKPELGEPKDEVIYSTAAIIGALLSFYYWRKAESRKYATEVAEELSKVTWPTRKEVTNSTTVVILTTLLATAFFALMDQFWRYVTDKIYSF